MSDASAHDLRLRIDFPQPWVLGGADRAPSVADMARLPAAGAAVRDAAAALAQGGEPDLLARLFQPLGADDGEVLTVLMATCGVYLFRRDDLAGPIEEVSRVVTGVEFAAGVSADFYELTLPIAFNAQDALAVLMFSTPNLPIVSDMEAVFRSIAASARLESGAA